MAEVVDLTTDESGKQSILECEVVYEKIRKGRVRFDGTVLSFEAEEESDVKIYFPITAIKGMQVSKAGSSKALLKIMSDSSSQPESLFDFTSTINGLAWRDAFKEGLAKQIRSTSDTNASSPSKSASLPCEKTKNSASNGGVSQSPAGKKSEDRTVKLSASDIKRFLETHPALLELYAEQVYLIASARFACRCHALLTSICAGSQVPCHLSEAEFWTRSASRHCSHVLSTSHPLSQSRAFWFWSPHRLLLWFP